MDSPFKIVASIKAKTGEGALVYTELSKLVEPCRLNEDCIQFDVLVDMEDPDSLFFCEQWQTREHWLAHMHCTAVRTCIMNIQRAVAVTKIHEVAGVVPYASEADDEKD